MIDPELPSVPIEFLSDTIYQPLETITPEEAGVTVTELPEYSNTQGSPFKSESPPMVLRVYDGSRNNAEVLKISRAHGRAGLEADTHGRVYWGDANSINAARDWKGIFMPGNPETGLVDFQDLVLEFDRTGTYSVRSLGLLDASGLLERDEGEKIMRQIGLPTEHTARTFRIDKVPYNGEIISIEEAINRLREKYQNDETLHERYNSQREKCKVPRVENPAAYLDTYLINAEFFIIERHLHVAERVRDFQKAENFVDLLYLLHPSFNYLNQIVCGRHRKGFIETNHIFRLDNMKDIEKYFFSWLPQQMGYYLGTMHRNEVTHGYSHQQNWSGVGTLYDLDSMAAAWNLPYPMPDDFYKIDLLLTVGEFARILDKRIIPMLFYQQEMEKPSLDYLYDNLERALVTFMKQYLLSRYPDQNQKLRNTPEQWYHFFEEEIEKYFFTPGVHQDTNERFRLFNRKTMSILNNVFCDVGGLKLRVLRELANRPQKQPS